jgi:hypothetical protein
MAWMANNFNQAESNYPDITEGNIEEHLEKFPSSFSSPIDLMVHIGDYIKSNMSYDLVSQIGQRDDLILKTEVDFSGGVDNIMQVMGLNEAQKKQILEIHSQDDVLATLANIDMKGGKYDFSDKQMENLKPILWVMSNKLNALQNQIPPWAKIAYTQLVQGFKELENGVLTKNKDQIKEALTCTPTLSNFLLLSSMQSNIDLELNTKASIGEYLKDIKVGVCRHFSMIAKILYNRLKGRIKWDSESELIYVAQHTGSGGHAYNLLMWTEKWPDGKEVINKEYIDITSHIGWKLMFKKLNGFFGNNKEIRVNHVSKNNNGKPS